MKKELWTLGQLFLWRYRDSVPVKVVFDSEGRVTGGYSIAFTVYEDGSRTPGAVSVTKKVPAFTPGVSLSIVPRFGKDIKYGKI